MSTCNKYLLFEFGKLAKNVLLRLNLEDIYLSNEFSVTILEIRKIVIRSELI